MYQCFLVDELCLLDNRFTINFEDFYVIAILIVQPRSYTSTDHHCLRFLGAAVFVHWTRMHCRKQKMLRLWTEILDSWRQTKYLWISRLNLVTKYSYPFSAETSGAFNAQENVDAITFHERKYQRKIRVTCSCSKYRVNKKNQCIDQKRRKTRIQAMNRNADSWQNKRRLQSVVFKHRDFWSVITWIDNEEPSAKFKPWKSDWIILYETNETKACFLGWILFREICSRIYRENSKFKSIIF